MTSDATGDRIADSVKSDFCHTPNASPTPSPHRAPPAAYSLRFHYGAAAAAMAAAGPLSALEGPDQYVL